MRVSERYVVEGERGGWERGEGEVERGEGGREEGVRRGVRVSERYVVEGGGREERER